MSDILYIVIGFSIIFISTTLGSSLVFFFKNDIKEKTNTIFLGFAAGIMIAASIWSLLIPSIDLSQNFGKLSFIPAVVGFVVGGLFLVVIDHLVPHFHVHENKEEGLKNHLSKENKMFLAVTIHNIPEGLAVGFAFGAAYVSQIEGAMFGALILSIGIAIQNFPEGVAVALPIKGSTNSRLKGFLYGTFSGIVEPIFAIVGFFLASSIEALQPWMLAFAAGAMIFVVIEDLIPEAQINKHSHLGTYAIMAGFVVMMILDVMLG